jgi:dCMP deaminase
LRRRAPRARSAREAEGLSGEAKGMPMRPGWDEYFMQVARTVATRATCPRASVGAVIVRDQRILTTGYNGAPHHVAHCTEVGCQILNDHCVRTTHAEANAVVQGALHGVSLAGATIYATHQPCLGCSKLLIGAGIVRIVYADPYPDALASSLLSEAGVALVPFTSLEGVRSNGSARELVP